VRNANSPVARLYNASGGLQLAMPAGDDVADGYPQLAAVPRFFRGLLHRGAEKIRPGRQPRLADTK
jgi:hypothetical protein